MIRYSSKYLFKRFSYRVAFFYKQKLSLITILSYFLIALFQGIWFNFKSLNLYNSLAHRRERRDRRAVREETEEYGVLLFILLFLSVLRALVCGELLRIYFCQSGGIGRHARLKIWSPSQGVRVQLPSLAFLL